MKHYWGGGTTGEIQIEAFLDSYVAPTTGKIQIEAFLERYVAPTTGKIPKRTILESYSYWENTKLNTLESFYTPILTHLEHPSK